MVEAEGLHAVEDQGQEVFVGMPGDGETEQQVPLFGGFGAGLVAATEFEDQVQVELEDPLLGDFGSGLVETTEFEDQVQAELGESLALTGPLTLHFSDKNSTHLCHPALHLSTSVSGRCSSVVSPGVFGGASVWGRGSSGFALCCPGCGLFGDGNMCGICIMGAHDGDGHKSCMQYDKNSFANGIRKNLRVVRSHEVGEGTKTLKVSSRIQVGCPLVQNVPGSARLADYLRWAPRR